MSPAKTRRFSRPGRRASTTEWLELLAPDGPFLAAPVVNEIWPSGLPALDRDAVGHLRDASGLLDASPGTRDAFVHHVLADFLGWHGNFANSGTVAPMLTTQVPEHHTDVRPDFALLAELDQPAARPLLLGVITDPGVHATAKPRAGAPGAGTWNTSAADRLAYALRAQKVPLGLVTDGSEWTLVCAVPGGATTTATWTRHTWLDEPDTLKAFHALLGRLRFYGVPDAEHLPAMLAASLERQEEITERLSEQSQAVVEMLVATIGRLDADHRAQHGTPLLPAHVEPAEIYQAAVAVLMRLVFLLYAEERGLLPLDDDTYAAGYAASTLAGQLRDRAGDAGEDTLERSSAAWHRLLATFRAVHRGARHDQLNLPGYGGSLFDPDRYPWLEGRADAVAPLQDCQPLKIDDRTLLRALEALQWLRFVGERRRVSFRVLDVEQIGYVYEGLLDQDARRSEGWTLGIAADNKGEKNGPEMALVDLQRHLAAGPVDFADWLSPLTKDGGSKRSPAAIKKALIPATGSAGDHAWTGVLEACGGNQRAATAILPFAGLLRHDPRELPVIYAPGTLYLTDSELRSHTGGVYTPRMLAESVVVKALEPLVYTPGPLETEDKADWKIRTPEQITDLKVVDIAAGSGAFLVAATRYLADRLLDARQEHQPRPESLPVDDEQQVIDARRRILDHCIYGVDINPMAIEMAKLSLWLVTLDRQRPFGFLDDRLAVGDSLLGITSMDQLLTLHLDPQAGRRIHHGALPLWTADMPGLIKQSVDLREQIAEVDLIDSHDGEHKARLLNQARAATEQLEITADALSGASLAGGQDQQYLRVAQLADTATVGTTETVGLDAWTQLGEEGQFGLTDNQGTTHQPAHFPLLFPEVFARPHTGFDAVVGNPPFLGGKKISGVLGGAYRDHLVRAVAHGRAGNADLVAYMFLRAASVADLQQGQLGLIATNTLAQGDTREVGLDQIAADGIDIRAAIKSAKWPTKGANLEYCVVWASRKQRRVGVRATADGVLVETITPALDPAGRTMGNPRRLHSNQGIAFQGSIVLGLGFTMTGLEAEGFISKDPRNIEILFPYVNGDDLNSRPDGAASRWIINFFDWPEDRAAKYVECFDQVVRLVKQDRMAKKQADYRRTWWQYGRRGKALYRAIDGLDHVIAITLVSKVVMPVMVPTGQVFSHATAVFATDDLAYLALLSSAPHYWWAIAHASTMRNDLRYTPSDVFETLPLPVLTARMRAAGKALDKDRRAFMLGRQLGLTKTYNLIHDSAVKDAEVVHLRQLHVEVDDAVCEAYGWSDLPLGHGHHETRQGVRWTVCAAARVELLDRLLELNHARYAEEQRGNQPKPAGRRRGGTKKSPPDDQDVLFGEELV
ncbi:DNA methyltransferase [Amycolatopsis sp. NPDC051128]|uniref:DNA methyltransferase n=1 Tax=Amycolatopsis sp. NPDC051128 TaxID=3155412 RepID=UPI003444E46A